MQVEDLISDATTKTPIVVLCGVQDNDLKLKIPIGSMESMSLSMALNLEPLPRPLTHDLILLTIAAVQGQYVRSEITTLKDGMFYAGLLLRSGERFFRIDSRPCDAITLAVRARKPILVSEKIFSLLEEQTKEGQECNCALDSANEMLRRTNARHMVDMMSVARHQTVGMPADDDPERDSKLLDLLRSLEPQTKHKM